jgi:hypothetical protein
MSTRKVCFEASGAINVKPGKAALVAMRSPRGSAGDAFAGAWFGGAGAWSARSPAQERRQESMLQR